MKNHRRVRPHPVIDIIKIVEQIGVARLQQRPALRFFLAAAAGIFLAIAAVFHITISQQSVGLLGPLTSGLFFTLSLVPVTLAGADLFPSMVATAVATVGGYISRRESARNGLIVCAGNVSGILFFTTLLWFSGLCTNGDSHWGLRILQIADQTLRDSFIAALGLGITGNLLLCLSVGISYACRSLTDKTLVMLLPLSLFAASGAAHSMVSLFLIPLAIAIHHFAPADFWLSNGASAAQFPALTVGHFIADNLLPVTLGNLIGGGALAMMVARFLRWRPYRNQD